MTRGSSCKKAMKRQMWHVPHEIFLNAEEKHCVGRGTVASLHK